MLYYHCNINLCDDFYQAHPSLIHTQIEMLGTACGNNHSTYMYFSCTYQVCT